MPQRPNILFLMADQLQGRVFEPGHPCQTPNLDRLIARGVRITRGYTPNAVCSPARASLMTGLLPHGHGVLTVNHATYDYHCDIQPDAPHFAQALVKSGCRTAYFGKWHVERSDDLARFGWQTDGSMHTAAWREHHRAKLAHAGASAAAKSDCNPACHLDRPQGYRSGLLYGVTDLPPELRGMGITTDLAEDFIRGSATHNAGAGADTPWCCFVSVTEPHDPFVCGREAFSRYDVDAIDLPPNFADDLAGKPNLYRKAAGVFSTLADRQKREAMACYWASITEIDQQFGRLLDALDQTGQADNTIVVLTSDHGELLGAHQLYMKNVSAFEEVYHVPMVVAGPGVARGAVSTARVGLHDLAPTLCELATASWTDTGHSRSFASALRDPQHASAAFQTGFAEYFGTRYWLTQRVIWSGPWKLVWNGFDFDELYHLDDDPFEMTNRMDDPACREVVRELMAQAYDVIRRTGDHVLLNAQYPVLRLAPAGPDVA